MVEIKINGKTVQANEGETILEVATREGIYIPSLCHHEAVAATGACRMCVVEAGKAGRKKKIVTACTFPVSAGVEVETSNDRVKMNQKLVLELLMSRAPQAKILDEIACRLDLEVPRRFEMANADECILCGLCVRVCDEVVGANAITFNSRGADTKVGGPLMESPEDCIGCAACVYVCPTDCIKMTETAEARTIVKWDRVLPMKKCAECGWPFMPNFQALQFRKMTEVPKEFFSLCPDCRKH
ncbi:(2Fe-2S)-binding protein [Myxococcota bacterium]|nr:(2Fe-2S)-binding protein [Myxococcota bacterium]MBU1379604.1 (2Fe-2S)-binding protein [Myxococcota bacterium]MBU1496301.1 (2Fe-2S)-binding protein [Myxococcota bacterium]